MRKHTVALWAFYDFANSIVVVVFLLYFSQWLVVDHGVADIWYNLIFVISSLLLVLTAPITAYIADRRTIKMPYLRLLTLSEFLFLILASVLAAYFAVTPVVLISAAVCFLLSNYLHQFALIFYNSLLPSIADRKSEGRISGYGLAAKFSGTVAGLAVAVPLSNRYIALLGNPGRSQTFLPAVFIALLLTIPPLYIRDSNTGAVRVVNPRFSFRTYFSSFLHLVKYPGVGRYLLGYFFFNDAMLTIQDNMPIYMARVLGVSDKMKSVILGGGLGAAAIGALIGAWLSDRIGLKRSLLGVLITWTVFLPGLALVNSVTVFAALSLIMGILFGFTWTVTRAVMAYLAPADNASHAFSYYTVAERFSTFVGPVAWGGLVTVLNGLGPVRYRIALLAMTAFVLVGLVVVRHIPSDKKLSSGPINAPSA